MPRRLTRPLTIWLACTLICLSSLTSSRADADSAELEALLASFDRVQGAITTLTADFTETTTSALLKDAIVAQGKIFMTKPSSVRWEYSTPEVMRFVIADDRYTGYFPARKQAEQRDIQRWREQLFRFLGLGQASDELAKFYDIRLDGDSPVEEGVTVIVLDPQKRRVRKRMDSVRFWIDRSSYLPVRVEYTSAKGDTRSVVFKDMQVNTELAASLYQVELPQDVEISKGFSALSGFSSQPQD